MPDKRIEKRRSKRLKLTFSTENDLPKIGFLEDVSENGLFVKSVFVYPPNSILSVEIEAPKNEKIILTGRVMWARRVPHNMMRRIKGGMGLLILKFVEGEELFKSYIR